MGDVIDLATVSRARRYFQKLLDARGLPYFLAQDTRRPLRIDAKKVALVVRAASRTRGHTGARRLSKKTVEHCEAEIRRELIRRVAETMLNIGL